MAIESAHTTTATWLRGRMPSVQRSSDSDGNTGSARLAWITFVVFVAASFPLLLYLGRHRWFAYDEWDFLVARDGADIEDLLRPHATHWTTIPILVYRVLWHAVGLHSYAPYQAIAVALHLIVIAEARAVMRRAEVRPWTATIAASFLLLFGAGQENILWAFQMTFGASLALGFAHLLLADHDGLMGGRDVAGLLLGGLGLLCSGLAVPMTLAVGAATLIRRGVAAAAIHTLPLGAAYVLWFALIGHDDYNATDNVSSVSDVLRFCWIAITTTFDGIAQVPGVGVAVGVALVAGFVLAIASADPRERRKRFSSTTALMFAALVFLLISAIGRASLFGPDLARATRYTYVVAVLLIPVIAVAVDALLLRWRMLAPVIAIASVLSLAGNVRMLDDGPLNDSEFQSAYRAYLFSAAEHPKAEQLGDDVRPDPRLTPWATLGWLRSGVDSGHIPSVIDELDESDARTHALVLMLRGGFSETGNCDSLPLPAGLTIERGESIRIGPRTVRVTLLGEDGVNSKPVEFSRASGGLILTALAGPLDLYLDSGESSAIIESCKPDRET